MWKNRKQCAHANQRFPYSLIITVSIYLHNNKKNTEIYETAVLKKPFQADFIRTGLFVVFFFHCVEMSMRAICIQIKTQSCFHKYHIFCSALPRNYLKWLKIKLIYLFMDFFSCKIYRTDILLFTCESLWLLSRWYTYRKSFVGELSLWMHPTFLYSKKHFLYISVQLKDCVSFMHSKWHWARCSLWQIKSRQKFYGLFICKTLIYFIRWYSQSETNE